MSNTKKTASNNNSKTKGQTMKTATKAKSLNHVRKALAEQVHPALILRRHHDAASYYLSASDEELDLKLCGMFSTTIGVSHWSQLSIEQWVECAKEILNGESY